MPTTTVTSVLTNSAQNVENGQQCGKQGNTNARSLKQRGYRHGYSSAQDRGVTTAPADPAMQGGPWTQADTTQNIKNL